MNFGTASLFCLLAGTTAASAGDLVRYSPRAPVASATLLVDGSAKHVQILDEANIEIRLVPPDYPDPQLPRQIALICTLPYNHNKLSIIKGWVDHPYHLIPVDVLEYKTYDSSYIKIGINSLFFENRIDRGDVSLHKVAIRFFADP